MKRQRASGARIRVLWVAKGLGPGGMERLLVHQARAGDRERFDYHVAYVVDRPNSVIPELEALDVPVHVLDGRHGPTSWARSLRQLVRSQDVDIVHLHSPAIAAVARPALRSLRDRPAIMSTEHNSWDCYSWATRLANVATYPLDDTRLAVSRDAVDSVPRPLRGTSTVLVHGIDLPSARESTDTTLDTRAQVRSELGIDESAPLIIVVANHRREKGWDIVIDAARELHDVAPTAVVIGVGHGDLEGLHRQTITQLGLDDSVRLLGFRSDVGRLLAASDVFALGSRQEGLPVAVMEAMASGLPIVAPRVGGLPLAVDDGETGFLVDPENSGALASALVKVVNDADLRRELSAKAFAAAQRFDVRRSVASIEREYADLARLRR